MIVTRKLELFILQDDKQKRMDQYAFIRTLDRTIFRAANDIISDQWLLDRLTTRIAEPDTLKINTFEEKITLLSEERKGATDKRKIKIDKEIESYKKKRNGIYLEGKKRAQEKLKNLVGVGTQQMSWQLIMAKYPDLRSAIIDPLTQQVTAYYRKDYKDVMQGVKSVRRYKKGMPIPFRATNLRFEKTDKGFKAFWLNGIVFGIRLGRDRGSRANELNKIMEGEYDYGDSSIQLKDKKLFLLLSLKHPDTTLVAEKDKVLFVEAGFKIPVSAYLSKEEEPVVFGSADDIIRFRVQLQSRRRKLHSALKIAAGGHGRQKKLSKLDDLGNLEQNWIKTYNHKLSKSVVNLAIRQRCSNIHLIEWKLDPGMTSEEKLKFEGRNWAGHMLKSMIDYKCKLYGIKLTTKEEVVEADVVSE